ncbi:MAG: transcription factor cyclin-related protein, partial [Candidatus Nitrosotenuis sp.]|nr:transcription factor cyclin-related protein [Candidatus Nitrosotenuis sp.]
RSIKGMVGACVYFACRDAEIARNLNDVAKTINIPKKDLTKSYRSLLREFGITVPPPNPINSVSKIANIVGLSEKTKRKAIEFLEKEKEIGGFEGRDPNGLAAAVLYVVGVRHGEVKSQKQMSLAAGVTEVTVRNRIKGLNKSILREFSR